MTIEKQNSFSTIDDVLNYLHINPDKLKSGLLHPLIKIVFSNKRKKYTEFYRIRLESKYAHKKNIQYFWIRIVKNKPTDVIENILNKQFSIMEKLFLFFNNNNYKNLHLSCCKPVLFLPQFRAIITQECSGYFFNNYLQRQLPVIKKQEILEICFNCGIWLKEFHQYFKNNNISNSEKEKYLNKFKNKYNQYPKSELKFITSCHNDYSPRNIFVGKNSVEVIDFVGVEKGFPEQDIIFFSNYILKARFNLLYPKTFKKKMVDSFYKGYDFMEYI